MEKTRLEEIRNAEKKSHMEVYSSSILFEEGTWLKSPIKTVIDVLPVFKEYKKLRVLDLGCGVGRNSIPIAQQYSNIDCKIECVDILNFAVDKLNSYSKKYNVESNIKGIVKSLERYSIRKNYFDFIMAISALEHIESKTSFINKINGIKEGISDNGIICLVVNSNVTEINKETGQNLESQFEVNIATDEMRLILENTFINWHFIKFSTVRQQYDIPREGHTKELTTNVITLVAQKC